MNTADRKRLALYLHVPFCKSKCAYCDFYSLVPNDDTICERYADALVAHMDQYRRAAADYAPDTVYIGGGTPTSLPIEQLLKIIHGVKHNFSLTKHPEFTVEANPATVTYSDLTRLRRAGMNRLSMGLQSADDRELHALSRRHNRAGFEETYNAARRAKIDNISVDLMFGIPYQTRQSLRHSLEYAVGLDVDHISLYGLKIEDGTPFAKMRDKLPLPGEDAEYRMYMESVEYLESKGFQQYEISNFARAGKVCVHNVKYWNCDEYLGLGPAAHSYFNGNRFSFVKNLGKYITAIENPTSRIRLTDEIEEIGAWERVGEYVMLRLRMNAGIAVSEFHRRFGKDFDAMYGEKLSRFISGGYVTHRDGVWALTPRGMFVSNYILSDIL